MKDESSTSSTSLVKQGWQSFDAHEKLHGIQNLVLIVHQVGALWAIGG
jgi:hypothetical protein